MNPKDEIVPLSYYLRVTKKGLYGNYHYKTDKRKLEFAKACIQGLTEEADVVCVELIEVQEKMIEMYTNFEGFANG